jgi:phosphomannomutase
VTLIKSISGIRGTIGGSAGEGLTPPDVVKFTTAYAQLLSKKSFPGTIVIGRDARMSGNLISQLVGATLNSLGWDVTDLGLSTTPTVEIAVIQLKAAGGIVVSASHNSREWNALKLLNRDGEFLSRQDGAALLDFAEKGKTSFAANDKLGRTTCDDSFLQKHIDLIVRHPLVDVKAIQKKNFRIVADTINSTGALVIPPLLKALGVTDLTLLFGEVNGKFEHNPEPLPENLIALSNEVKKKNADLGIAVDPDVDRLCFVCEDGSMFGEEYTLVAVADYVLATRKGNTVSNLSSTQALKEVTVRHGGDYYPSAVGEVNVVAKMKEVNAVIGGEGNGGIILPELHYGRDALVGIALFLSQLAHTKKGVKALRSSYPDYYISKNKIDITGGIDATKLMDKLRAKYPKNPVNTEDGLRIEFDGDWVHLRTSNTEPIIRIYAESRSSTTADNIARRIMQDIQEFLR